MSNCATPVDQVLQVFYMCITGEKYMCNMPKTCMYVPHVAHLLESDGSDKIPLMK